MTRRSLLDRLLRLYPPDWRDRYGDEVRDLVVELIANGEFSAARITLGIIVSALVQRVRSLRPSWRTVAVTGTVLALVAAGIIVAFGSRSGQPSEPSAAETKGTIPPATNGIVNTKKVPDFISALGRDGKIVGYIPRAYLFPGPVNQPVNSKVGSIAPVYANDLKTLVGYMYPGVGFVALGKSVASQPCTHITTFGAAANAPTTTGTIACPSTGATVPNIIGIYLPNAMGQLQAESLQATITYMHSSSVAAGHVISVMPLPNTKVPARSVLSVVSSIGSRQAVTSTTVTTTTYPSMVVIPNIIGLSLATALGELHDIAVANVTYMHSASVPKGDVISVTPSPFSKVAGGQVVSVVSSLGPS